MKRRAIIFLILALVIPLVSANIDLQSKLLNEKVYPGTIATFDVTVTNLQPSFDVIRVDSDYSTIHPFSQVFDSVIAQPSTLKLRSGESQTIKVNVKINEGATPEKTYGAGIIVKSITNPDIKINHLFSIYISPGKDLVDIDADWDKVISGEETNLKLTLKNKADVDLPLTIYVTSELFSDKLEVYIKAKETATEEIKLDVTPNLLSGDYKLEVKAYKDNNLRGSFVKEVYLGEKSDIGIKEEKESNFLKRTTTVTLVNEGNVYLEDSFTFDLNLFQRIFTKTIPDSETINTKEGYQLKWDYRLGPGDSYEIQVVNNYRPLFAIILILILLWIVVKYFFKRGIGVRKKIKKRTKGYQIDIVIKNYGNNNIRNVKVVEILPRVLQPIGHYGTMKPENVKRGRRGLRMEWELPLVEKKQEIILSYKAEIKADVFGDVTLFGTIVKYVNKHGKHITEKSNSVKVSN